MTFNARFAVTYFICFAGIGVGMHLFAEGYPGWSGVVHGLVLTAMYVVGATSRDP